MNKIFEIDSLRLGQVGLCFDNGIRLSFIWDFGSYTDNYMKRIDCLADPFHNWVSKNIEVYSNSEEVNTWLEEKYGNAPAPRVPVDELIEIINYIRNMGEESK